MSESALHLIADLENRGVRLLADGGRPDARSRVLLHFARISEIERDLMEFNGTK